MRVELRELRGFVAVVEECGLSAAARRLNPSQPAVSQLVASLERRLGVQLLVRSSTGVRTTDALPPALLPSALAALAAGYPDTRPQLRHLSTSAQLTALRTGGLDLGLVREHPAGHHLDATLVVEERLGVLLTSEHAERIAGPAACVSTPSQAPTGSAFPRTGSPAWYDELTSVLRSHGLAPPTPAPEGQSLIAELKLATVGAGGAFALAPPDWPAPLPETITWTPLVGHPLVRRTWAVWRASSHRRDLGHLVAALPTPRARA